MAKQARLYDEKQIGAILKRTAELGEDVSRPVADGLTLAEIQQLAADAGLNPQLVAQAAAELSVPSNLKRASDKPDLFGGPLAHVADIDLAFAISQDTWERMLPIIRAHFDDPGNVATRKGTFEWTSTGGDMNKKTHVHVRRTETGSRLHLFWSEKSSAIPFYIPTFISFVISLPILFEEFQLGLIGIPVMIAIVGAFFMLSRLGVQLTKKRNVNRLNQLGQELTRVAFEGHLQDELAEAGSAELTREADKSSTGSPRPTEKVIDLDELGSDESGRDVTADRSRERS